MPFWGLVITSIGFIIPSFLAFRYRKKRMGTVCSILSGTSVLYHGTHNIIFKMIDTGYAHSVGCFYMINSIKRCFIHRRLYDFIIMNGTFSSIYVFYKGSCNNDLNYILQNYCHMVFHIISQSMMCMHAIDSL